MEQIKIICVDDEPEILEILNDLLTSEGYAVRCAPDGEQAIEAFRREPADVIITDLRMPGMDGLEVLRTIKEIDDLTEVIILTGYGSLDTAVSALKNDGAFDFLTKPLQELDDLLLTIEKALSHRALCLENTLLMEELSRNQAHLAHRNKALRRAQKELEQSRQRYLDLYNRAPVGYIALGAQSHILEANLTAATLFNTTTDALRHKAFADFVPHDHLEQFNAFCTNMAHTASSVCELPLYKDNDVLFYAHIEGITILDTDGLTHQYRMTVSDITSQKEIALALNESEQRYRTLVETIPHGIQEIDTDGTITFANAGHATLHGYKTSELVGKSVAELSRNAAQGESMLRYLKILEKSQPAPRTWFGQDRTRDGQVKDIQVDWNYKRNTEGEVVGFVSVLSDISERKKAEIALRESEVRYRSFVENFTGIAFRLTPTGLPIFYHGAVEAITGYSEASLAASQPGWEELIHQEDLSLVRMRRKRIGLPGTHSITQEYRIRHKNHQWRWVREHIQHTQTRDEETSTIQGVLFDITDYKQLQNRLFDNRKLEAIATLAGGVAHQFNNALAGLMGNVELLDVELHEQHQTSKAKKYTQAMMKMIRKMSQLTDQLLAYARGGKYLPAEMSLNALIQQSISLMRHRVHPDIEIEIELTPENDCIRADTAQLQMVFLAIMDNALESGDQEGFISIRTHKFTTTPEFVAANPELAHGDYISLTIRDNGCGMDEHTRRKIFEPFFTTKFVGRGLGLSAAYGIVANHNGWIDVASSPGSGTAVSINLPAVSPKEKQPAEGTETPPLAGEATILIVEDDTMVMLTLNKLLKKLHYRVLEAINGRVALEMLRTFKNEIDAVLLDIRLPDMKADELYAHMLKIHPDIRVLACSGYGKEGPAEALLDAGALGFLQKPFSVNTLAAKLHNVLQCDHQCQETIDIETTDQSHSSRRNKSHLKLV